MGAALTYAMRYALFTLVGIAGEDDLDAPDLTITIGTRQQPEGSLAAEQRLDAQPPAALPDPRRPTDRPDPPRSADRSKAIPLTEEDSASLRDRLLSELEELTREEDLDAWSMCRLRCSVTMPSWTRRSPDKSSGSADQIRAPSGLLRGNRHLSSLVHRTRHR
jgi:hypothetical protein